MTTVNAAIFVSTLLSAGLVYSQTIPSEVPDALVGQSRDLKNDPGAVELAFFAVNAGDEGSAAPASALAMDMGRELALSNESVEKSGLVTVWGRYRLLPEHSLASAHAWAQGGTPLSATTGPMPAGMDGDDKALMSASRWLDRSPGISGTVGATSTHRSLHGARVSISQMHDERDAVAGNTFRSISRSTRFSFSPARDWVLQFTRGSVSGLDYLVPGDEVRRSALSATYTYKLSGGDWKTSVAWGRTSRKFRESTLGYLVESSYRFNGEQVFFGRLERVASDDLLRQNDLAQRQLFKLNKLTAGYYQGVRVTSSLSMDVGVFASRHFVPAEMAPSYGGSPTAYMMFMRFKMQ